MDDQTSVRELHRAHDAEKERQTILERERVLRAIRRDRHALDELEDDVRASVVERAAVEDRRDAGMNEARERFALDAEAPHHLAGAIARDAAP